MKPSDSVAAFECFVEDRRTLGLVDITVREAVEHMLAFYTTLPAEGCNAPHADQLFFQWGTYDWGEGEAFEIGISRQFIEPDEDELSISQLKLKFRFEPTPNLSAFESGNHWCKSRDDVQSFHLLIAKSNAYQALGEIEGPNFACAFSCV